MSAAATQSGWSGAGARAGHVLGLTAGDLCVAAAWFLVFIIASDGTWSTVVSGLFPGLTIGPLIYLLAREQGWHRNALPQGAGVIAAILCGFAIVAGLSTVTHPLSADGVLPFLGAYVMPLILFVAFSVLRLGEQRITNLMGVIAAGSLVPMLLGAAAFYHEWGIPTGVDLLMSRYDLDRMQGYMSLTFGNTGNMAAYLAILVPSCLAAWFSTRGRRKARCLMFIVLALAFVHVLIVQSRTLFIVLLASFPLISIFYRLRFGSVVFTFLLGCTVVVIPVLTAADQFVELTVGAVSAGGNPNGDQSVSERLEAMSAALGILRDNPGLGVGPGNSLTMNPFTSAHEYVLQQGSEIGVIGVLLAAALVLACMLRLLGLYRLRGIDALAGLRFALVIGPFSYLLYGVLANMPLSENVMTPWIGLLSLMLGASFIEPETRKEPGP